MSLKMKMHRFLLIVPLTALAPPVVALRVRKPQVLALFCPSPFCCFEKVVEKVYFAPN